MTLNGVFFFCRNKKDLDIFFKLYKFLCRNSIKASSQLESSWEIIEDYDKII